MSHLNLSSKNTPSSFALFSKEEVCINVKWRAYSHNEEKYSLKQNGVHITAVDLLNTRQGLNALYAITYENYLADNVVIVK